MCSSPVAFCVLFLGGAACLVMNSWVTIWVMLEINTLAFCVLMKPFTTEKKSMSEMSMKYLIIQSIASILLLFSSAHLQGMKMDVFAFMYLSMAALLVKMASSPFHQWFVNIAKNSKWKQTTTLMTWQKLAPVFLITYQMKVIMFPFLLLTASLGSISQMNKKNMVEILAYSSIFNLGWMLLAITLNTKTFIVYTTFYWSTVILMMAVMWTHKMKFMNKENSPQSKKWIYFIVILNLAGVPPLSGFLAKWLVLKDSASSGLLPIITTLLIMSSINLYIYMRMSNSLISSGMETKQKGPKSLAKLLMSVVMLVNTYPLMMFT